jgi:hypothetical protein
MERQITFGEMRESGVRGVLIYCSDYKCSHSIAISGDQWPDDVRISARDIAADRPPQIWGHPASASEST